MRQDIFATIEEAIRLSDKQNIQKKIRDVALFLRGEVLQAGYTPLPNNVSLEDIRKGEVNTPEDLVKFFRYLVGGPYVGRKLAVAKNYRIKSISKDVVLASTSGRRRPAKHLQIGMAIKSLADCKKAVTMLNRLGHCINYNRIEELQTELTYNCSIANQITPSGISKENSCSTRLAFDNYGRFKEALSGKDTLHDTVGIAYQTVSRTHFYRGILCFKYILTSM